ncbi:mRNA 3' end processing factor [Lecanora helva]
MSVGLPSDEIAEDYKNSLADLTLNSRFEISNLTIIAKENTEHALAISRVLENHIKTTPPDRKLPALYLLDSIVKNVGTPYTLFLGRNLHFIFMNAYSLVNPAVRKKLDEMLKTWKEPVPGSLDQRPVFPPDTTRPIDNALIKARTAAIQAQEQQRARNNIGALPHQRPTAATNTQWRNTQTPPQPNGRYYPPPQQAFPSYHVPNAQYQQRPPYPQQPQYPPPTQAPQPQQPLYQQPTPYPQYPPTSQNLDSLNRDIAELIRTTKDQLAANVYDQAIQRRLQALLSLQTLMGQQQLPPDQLQLIRDQITALAAPAAHPPARPPYSPAAQTLPPQQQPLTLQQRPPVQAPPPPHNSNSQASLDSNNLADIIARAQRSSTTPQTPHVSLAHDHANPGAHPPTQSGPTDLLATLRAKGFLPSNSHAISNGSASFSQPPSVTPTPASIPPVSAHTSSKVVELTSASLKRPRPHLISALYEARPNQCSTCGRRFLATDEGKEKKARHLDWHFRTNSRLADSAKRGQSRSWYVDELEWIKSRDNPEDAPITEASSAAAKAALAASAAAADPKNKVISVPSDPVLRNQPCPICQEQFDTVWNEERELFVWRDAVSIGSRIYHASCHSELKKDGGSTPGRTKTPDSVLGKRKAVIAGVSDLRVDTQRQQHADTSILTHLKIPDIPASNAKAIKA